MKRSTSFRSSRSTDAPMDYEYTSRPSKDLKPVWAAPSTEEPSTPRKRNHDNLTSVTPLNIPKFGANQNIPFIFHEVPQQASQPYPWTPPSNFSPSKVFSPPDMKDVDMSDASPPAKSEEPPPESGGRVVATGALRRVYNSRHKVGPSRVSKLRNRVQDYDDDDDLSQASDDDNDHDQLANIPQKMSNHYTLNVSSPAAPTPHAPVVLLGYLQFFFNLSLVLIFLYLFILFILTVQRDVEHRITEYSMEIMQEIASCTARYKENNCHSALPALEKQCSLWEVCMNRDPTKLGRASVGAEMIAEVFNSFVDAISWKTMFFSLSSLASLTFFVNSLLSFYRAQYHSSSATPSTQASLPPVPSTPFRPDHFGGYLSPAATPSWGRSWKGMDHDELLETPTRRRRLESGGSVKIK